MKRDTRLRHIQSETFKLPMWKRIVKAFKEDGGGELFRCKMLERRSRISADGNNEWMPVSGWLLFDSNGGGQDVVEVEEVIVMCKWPAARQPTIRF